MGRQGEKKAQERGSGQLRNSVHCAIRAGADRKIGTTERNHRKSNGRSETCVPDFPQEYIYESAIKMSEQTAAAAELRGIDGIVRERKISPRRATRRAISARGRCRCDVGRALRNRYSRPTLLRPFSLGGGSRVVRLSRLREGDAGDNYKGDSGDDDDDVAINLARLILECCLITL